MKDYQNLIGCIIIGICILIAGYWISKEIDGAGADIQGGLGAITSSLSSISGSLSD